MQILRLNNAGRKFHRFAQGEGLAGTRHQIMPSEGELWALRNVYITVNRGEIIGIIGRNGSGKTTLLSIMAGTLPASEGQVEVNGKISALLALGAGFQDEFTGKENIYLNASLLSMKRHQIDRVFSDIVEFSELGDFIHAPLGSYSTGMKMRLGFSIAIHRDFDALLTDEIIAVGDIAFQKKCFERMAEFKRNGKSMVIATQDMGLVLRFCDRAFLLEDGRVIGSGTPEDVVGQYEKLLSRKKILSDGSRTHMVSETKRWATDMHEWGSREGTKEVAIQEVVLLNRWGAKTRSVRTGERLAVRVIFNAQEPLDDFHFGIAIFREDGVYCYGPNTQLDGLAVQRMGRGSGYFELEIPHLSLMPGTYYLSTAIWDKNETFAYDYHKCDYRLEVCGDQAVGGLAALACRWKDAPVPRLAAAHYVPALELLADRWESKSSGGGAVIESVTCLNNYGYRDEMFVTGKELSIKIDLRIDGSLEQELKSLFLWVGVYRSDGIYCHGSVRRVSSCGLTSAILAYPGLRLLPGGYRVSAALWDSRTNRYLAYSHALDSFHMISEKRDHGTVYLEHRWRWHIPKGG